MGYSLSVPCRSPKAAKRLGAFLQKHSTPFSTLMLRAPERKTRRVEPWETYGDERNEPWDPLLYDPTAYVRVGYDLSYGGGATKVGFDFTSSGLYGLWMHALLSWVALRVGKRRGLNALSIVGHADQRVAYLTYDSTPRPVLSEADIVAWSAPSQRHARNHWIVDEYGMPIQDRSYGEPAPHEWLSKLVAERELQKFTLLWNKDA